MPRNGSGVYSPPGADFPAVPNTLIESTKFNNIINDLGTALTGSLTADGQTTVTADIPFGGFKITNIAAATAASGAARLSQVQAGGGNVIASVSGTNTITGSLVPAITAYTVGMCVVLIAAGTNTGAATLNLNSVGAVAIVLNKVLTSTALKGGEIATGKTYYLIFDDAGSDQWVLLNPSILAAGDGSSSAPSVRVGDEQNGLYSPAANVLGFVANGLNPVVLKSGKWIVGNTDTVTSNAHSTGAGIQSWGTAVSGTGLATGLFQDNTSPVTIELAKSRGATVGAHTVVQNGDILGRLHFSGSDGTGFIEAASIVVSVNAAPGTGDMPGAISFQTTADGASTTSEAMKIIRTGGCLFPGITTTASAANAFLDSGTTPANNLLRSTSSLRYKTNVREVPRDAINAMLSLQPIKYNSLASADNPEHSFYGLGAEDVALVDPRLVTWGKPVISDQLEDVETPEDYEVDEVVTETVEGLPVLKNAKVTKTRMVIGKKRVVRYSEELLPDGVAYDRIAALLLPIVKEQGEKIAELEAEIQKLKK